MNLNTRAATSCDICTTPDECNMIVCWKHNWPERPLEVIELRSEAERLVNK